MFIYYIIFYRIPWWSRAPREVLSAKEDKTYWLLLLAPKSTSVVYGLLVSVWGC